MRPSRPARSSRFLLALVAALAAPAARAQGTPATPPAQPAPAPAPAAEDPAREALRREIEKAKQEIRDEVRAELQAQESAKAFLQGADEEKRKLEFFEVDGYLRFRSDLLNRLDLSRAADPSGNFPYARPLISPDDHGTLTNVNMRLRLEPTLNVSEQIRVHTQVDVLDNLVLGSTPGTLSIAADPLGVRTQLPPAAGLSAGDRDSIRVKRAWAEVQTPVGLLAFGRQQASWGMGLLEHAGDGLDDDYGDSVDRLQFAIPLRSTPIGAITVVPYYDLTATGSTRLDSLVGSGGGQAVDAEQGDDATQLGFKIVKVETEEERRLALEQGLSSWNYGLYYGYRSQGYAFPVYDAGAGTAADPVGAPVRREASSHVLDLWTRWEKKGFSLEWEGTGIVGEIANASVDPAVTTGPVLIRQYGTALRAKLAASSRITLGAEWGAASGDREPGMGNRPGRGPAQPGDIDGQQFAATGAGDLRNFRFNPAYRVDLVLWREILGAVTDAWYLKPSIRYELIDGLAAQAAVIYSQAFYRESTPSTRNRALGFEIDVGLHYESDDGFGAWLDWGVLQPLDGWNGAGDLSRAHALRAGLAVKF